MNKDKIIIPAQNKVDTRQIAECRLSQQFMQKLPQCNEAVLDVMLLK